MPFAKLSAAAALLLIPGFAFSADPVDPRLTLSRIFESGELAARSYKVTWTENGKAWLRLEASESDTGGRDLVRYETPTGARSVLVSAAHLIPKGETKPLEIHGFHRTDDESAILFYTNSKRVWRANTRGDYWIFDPTALTLTQIASDAPPSSTMFAELSPQRDAVCYVRGNDLFVEDLRSRKSVKLTNRKTDDIINGTFDWVYEEEFRLRKGFEWSPDGMRVAYWQLDSSGVKEFVMLDRTSGLYPEKIRFKYPKAGETNAACRAGVVSRRGGKTTWLDIPGDPRNHYIVSLDWVSEKQIAVQQFNRLQNRLRIFLADADSGEVKPVATDRDKAWIMKRKLHWQNRQRFIMLSERGGWQHPWMFDLRKPGKPKRLSEEQFDVLDWLHDDGYAVASPDDATSRLLYRFDLRNGGVKRITPKGEPGVHLYDISPDGKHAVHTFSSRNHVPVTSLISLPDHKIIRTLEDNQKLAAVWEGIPHSATEYFKVRIGGGLEADAWCIKPPDFDPKKKYPLLVYVYGEPAGQTTTNSRGGKSSAWHHMLAQNGYVVMSFDNRGTPAPRGRAWRKSVYKRVGVLSSFDQAEAVRDVLKNRPYLDADRVGIWGWSGGGSNTLNALFRYPDLYKAGISIAPVANQRHYDTIYMERYMSLPKKNARGYKLGSPVHFAKNLKGDLLLIHGTADDNCHYAATETLIDELIRHRKDFEMFAYPGRSHSVSEKKGTTIHLYEKMTRFLFEKIPPNEGDADPSVFEPNKKKPTEKPAPKKRKKRAV